MDVHPFPLRLKPFTKVGCCRGETIIAEAMLQLLRHKSVFLSLGFPSKSAKRVHTPNKDPPLLQPWACSDRLPSHCFSTRPKRTGGAMVCVFPFRPAPTGLCHRTGIGMPPFGPPNPRLFPSKKPPARNSTGHQPLFAGSLAHFRLKVHREKLGRGPLFFQPHPSFSDLNFTFSRSPSSALYLLFGEVLK